MNGIIDSISNLLMPLCSVWIVNKFVNNSFEKKESKKIFTRIIWGLFILIQIVMETEKGNVSIQKGIISFFVILGIIIIGYKGTFQRKLLFTSLFISIWILSEFFVYFILNIYNFEEDREMLIGTILSKVLLLVLLFYVILKKLHKEAEGIDRKLWVILFLISIESICMAFIFYELYNGKNQIWIISFYTLLLLMNVSIFEIYKKSIYSLKLEKENMIYEQQLKLLRNCTQDQMNSTALFQREQHDLKNKLLGIRSSMEKQNVQDAIRMIDGILEHGNMVDKAELEKIGNDIIDTILRFKYAKAIQKNIVVKIDGFAMQKLPILDEDLCVVLGNMLDNAIEASEKVTDRWINVSIGLRKNGLVIVVENSFDGIIKKNIHGNIISIKENKEHHGYGLKSIRKTVEKYDGELVVEIRANIFRAVAFMTCIDYV